MDVVIVYSCFRFLQKKKTYTFSICRHAFEASSFRKNACSTIEPPQKLQLLGKGIADRRGLRIRLRLRRFTDPLLQRPDIHNGFAAIAFPLLQHPDIRNGFAAIAFPRVAVENAKAATNAVFAVDGTTRRAPGTAKRNVPSPRKAA